MNNEKITPRDVDFAKWYTDIIRVADLVDYSSMKGSMIIRPYGYAIWESMVAELDREFKRLGHQNVQMPMFIPESLLQIEKDHVEGFAPEVAWVTHGGLNELEERVCVRPTSETLFCEHFKKIIKSYRDLPLLYNQWCTIVRWERTTRPFLRSREILWQEGHTMHATKEEAIKETMQMLELYEKFQKDFLALPVLVGKKTDKEKFAGAEETYTIEAMMYDGVALQNGTSHYFGQNFAKAFDIKFLDKNNELVTPYQTSWGCTTRMIGGLIMTHSDDLGLVLPPKIAPIKVALIPIKDTEEITLAVQELKSELEKEGITYIVDESDKSPGFKFANAEVKGYPIRIEIGPRDLQNNHITLVRRDTLEKITINKEDGIAKVTDFGIAKAVSNSTITAFGTTIGSVHYFSPEHARGGFTDAKSDLYSLGVVMYEMVTGRVPFDADTPVSVALKHMQEEPEEPIEINPHIPVAINKIIMKASSK